MSLVGDLIREAKFKAVPFAFLVEFIELVYRATSNVAAGIGKDIRFEKIQRFVSQPEFEHFLLHKLPYKRATGEHPTTKRHEFLLRVNNNSQAEEAFARIALLAQEALATQLSTSATVYDALEYKLRVRWLTGAETGACFSANETVRDVKQWIASTNNSSSIQFDLVSATHPANGALDLDAPCAQFTGDKLVARQVLSASASVVSPQLVMERTNAAMAASLAVESERRRAEFAKRQDDKHQERLTVEHKRLATIQAFSEDRAPAERRAQQEVKKASSSNKQ